MCTSIAAGSLADRDNPIPALKLMTPMARKGLRSLSDRADHDKREKRNEKKKGVK